MSFVAHFIVIIIIILVVKKDKSLINHEANIYPPTLKSFIIYPSPKPKPTIIEKPIEVQTPDNTELKFRAKNMQQSNDNVIVNKVKNKETIGGNLTDTQQSNSENKPNIAPIQNDQKQAQKNPVVISEIGTTDEQKYHSLVTKHLKNYHNLYSQQQAKEYRELKTSPIIDTVNLFDSTGETLRLPEVKINCNNGGKELLVAISTLLSGTMKCNTNNEFQHYIDKRLQSQLENPINTPNDK